MHCILSTNINICRGENTTRRKRCPIFASAMYSRKWTRSGTNLIIFLEALCAQTNLFWCEMKIKKMYLKSNTRQENFRTFEENDILNGIKVGLSAREENISAWDCTSSKKSLCPLMRGFRSAGKTRRQG